MECPSQPPSRRAKVAVRQPLFFCTASVRHGKQLLQSRHTGGQARQSRSAPFLQLPALNDDMARFWRDYDAIRAAEQLRLIQTLPVH